MRMLPAIPRALRIASTLFLTPALVHATTYYVDSQDGNDANAGTSSGAAWRTLAKVNSFGPFSAGDSILFERGGEWTGQLAPQGAGSSGAPVVIDAYGSGALPPPLLQGNGAVYATILLENQPYWELKNLEVTNTGASLANRVGIYIGAEDFGQLSHIHLIDLIVHDVNGDDASPNGANGGVFFNVTGSTTPTWFNDILIDGCYVYNCAQRGITGPYSTWGNDRTLSNAKDWAPSTNVIIRNCLFEHCRRQGLVWRMTEAPLIEHNIFANCSDGAHGNAMFVFNTDDAVIQMNESYGTRYEDGNDSQDASGIDIDFRSKRTLVQYNYSHDNGEGGLLATGGPTNTSGSESFNDGSIIRYNILQNNRRWGMHFSGRLTNTKIYNNTIYLSSTLPEPVSIFHFGDWGGNWPDDTRFYNNIIANHSFNATYDLGSSTNNLFNYNLFYDANDAATGEPSDAHKSTANPLLVAGGTGGYGWATVDGYKLQASSPALNSGVLVSSNGGRDYFGNAVSGSSAPNRGAYQGAGVSQVAEPSFSPIGGTFASGQSVTISTATSGASIYYTTNGVTPSPQLGTLYSGAVPINSTALLQAVAVKSGLANSDVHGAPFIIPAGTTQVLEAEDMSVATSGATASTLNDTETSGGACKSITATTTSEWMEFTTPSIPAGTYRLSMRFKGYNTRGQHYVTLDGVQIGGTVDQYSATASYSTAVLGMVTFASPGTHTLRLVVNGTSIAPAEPADPNQVRYSITADHFVFLAPPPPVMETEELMRTASGATASVGADGNASGEKWVSFSADGVNDYVEFTTQHMTAGTYNLQLRFKGFTNRGIASVKVDGTTVGSVDQYDSATTWRTVNVGNVTFASAGTHTVRLTVTGQNASSSGYYITTDKITFAPASLKSEAESLSRTSSGATTGAVSDASASGGQWIVLNADGAGDYVQFTTASLPAGAYDLKLHYKAYPARGRLQVTVDGTEVGDELDQYAASTSYLTKTIGTVAFGSAGTHTIRLTVTGQNGSSSGFELSADAITLQPQ